MKRAIVYVRVSTGKQVQGASLENQIQSCQQWATSNDISVDRVFREEGKSAKNLDRPTVKELVEYLKIHGKKTDYLIIYQFDRLSREIGAYMVLKELLKPYKIEVKSATSSLESNPADRFVETVMVASAQLDNEIKGERVSDNMKQHAQKGYWMHKAPFGLKNVRNLEGRSTLEPIPGKAEVIARVLEMFATGSYTLTELLEVANTAGIRAKSGAMLSIQQLSKIIRYPIYAGYMRGVLTSNQLVKSVFDGIISLQTFERNQRILLETGGKRHYKTDFDEYPLRRFVLCQACGNSIRGSASTGSNGTRYPKYHCSTCKKSSVSVEDLESNFTGHLSNIAPSHEMASYIKRVIIKTWNDEAKNYINERKTVDLRIAELEHKKRQAIDKYLEGSLTSTEKTSYLESLTKEHEDLLLKRTRYSDLVSDTSKVVDYAINAVTNLPSLWQDASPEAKRKIQFMAMPEGLPYDFMSKKFGTTNLSPLFRLATNKKDPAYGKESLMVSSASLSWNSLYPDLISLSDKLGELGIEEYFDV